MGSDVGQVDIDNVSVVAGHVGAEDLTGTPTADPTDQVTDTGTDTGVDTGYGVPDTGVDTGTDTGVDWYTGTDTGPVELVAEGGFADENWLVW